MVAYARQAGRDLRHAGRLLRKSPTFAFTVLVSLALGIGGIVTMFTFVDRLLLRPLPVRAPHELYTLGTSASRTSLGGSPFSHGFYLRLRESGARFSSLTASSVAVASGVNLTAAGIRDRARVEVVSGNYFDVLGVMPRLGRLLTAADDVRPGGHPVAVLSHASWQRRFGGAPDVVGRTISLNQHPFVVVGVAPAGFFGTRPGTTPDFWVPLMMVEEVSGVLKPSTAHGYYLELMGRIGPDVSPEAFAAEASAIHRQWLRDTSGPGQEEPSSLVVFPSPAGRSRLRALYAQPLLLLMGASAVLWLACCANIATMLVVRGAARTREIAIRLAIGASRGRVVAQLMIESICLAMLGGVGGWMASLALTRALIRFMPDVTGAEQFQPDARVLVATAAFALLTAVCVGLAPAWRTTRLGLQASMRQAPSTGRRRWRWLGLQETLGVAQIALSLVLVVGAAFLARSLRHLRDVDPGFAREHVLLASVDPLRSGYTRERATLFLHEFADRVRREPGVIAAGWASHGSLSGVLPDAERSLTDMVHADVPRADASTPVPFQHNLIGPGYLAAAGIPLLAGRDFGAESQGAVPRVAILNQTAARRLFGGDDPLGRRIGRGTAGPATIEVIGFAKDVRYLNLREPPPPVVYLPFDAGLPFGPMTLHVRSERDPLSLVQDVRRALEQRDPGLPIFRVEGISARIDASLSQERVLALLVGLLGLTATVLAAVGLYGLVSYTASQRMREFGIRRALGARSISIVGQTVGGALRLTAMGTLVGTVAALSLLRWTGSLLYGLSPTDPATIAGAAAAVLAVALTAAAIPAGRATRVRPVDALRRE